MDGVWNAVALTIRRVVAKLAEPAKFLALTAQGDGAWLVDRAGRPTGPAILWNDARATAVVERWRAAGKLTEAFRRNGTQTFAGLPNGIFAWLREHDPERLERPHKSLCGGGWVFYNLTGRLAIDESDAAAPFFDVRERRYSPELLELCGLPWAERLLPDVVTDDERAGELTSEAAATLGLPRSLPVVLSLYDVASTAIGIGPVSVGQGCSVLGTTLCTEVVAAEPQLAEEPAGSTLPFGPGLYLRVFPTLAGGEVIAWAMHQLGLGGPDELSELAAKASPGAGGLLCLPYFSPTGERVPFLDPCARGSLHGMSFEHGREHPRTGAFRGAFLRDPRLPAGGGGVGGSGVATVRAERRRCKQRTLVPCHRRRTGRADLPPARPRSRGKGRDDRRPRGDRGGEKLRHGRAGLPGNSRHLRARRRAARALPGGVRAFPDRARAQ